jgi:hypothetical protein
MSSEDMRDFIAPRAACAAVEAAWVAFYKSAAIERRGRAMAAWVRRQHDRAGDQLGRRRVFFLLGALLACASAQRKRLTDADLRRIDEELTEEDEKEVEWKPKPIDFSKGQLSPADMQTLMQGGGGGGGGPTMVFAMLHYEGMSKEATDQLSFRWKSMLQSAGLDPGLFVITEDRILFTVAKAWHLPELKGFMLAQPETAAIEHNSIKTPGPADSPAYRERVAAHRAKSEGAKQERLRKAAAVSKAEKAARNKRKRKRANAHKDEV